MLGHFGYGVTRAMSKAALLGILATPGLAQTEIVALGDSLTAGYGLPTEEGFVPQLQAWLDARGHDVRIVNAGVSGDTTAGGLSRVDWSLSPETDAMIVTLGGNDLLRGIAPAVSRSNLEGILVAAQGRDIDVLVVGMEAPGNFGPEYKQSFDAMYPELAQTYDALYFPRFFEGLGGADATPASVRPFMQADGIHPNATGVTEIVAALGPAVEDLIARAQD